jgi:sulfite exporter TauE/SafE
MYKIIKDILTAIAGLILAILGLKYISRGDINDAKDYTALEKIKKKSHNKDINNIVDDLNDNLFS